MTLVVQKLVVHGLPAPQGSKRHVGNGVMVESSKKVKPWRADVRQAAEDWRLENGSPGPLTGSLIVMLTFSLPRPKARKKEHWVATRPDLDKLVRSTFDALTGVLWGDDSQVVYLTAQKTYVDSGELPGVVITIESNQGES